MVVEVDHPQWGRIKVLGSPVRFSEESLPVTCSPRLGEHTVEVLRSVLNISEEEIKNLHAQEVIGIASSRIS
jgi:crotonobetainyl-CoA:carnitine CoA-transferase CaiB-like acyl-CoA transferase